MKSSSAVNIYLRRSKFVFSYSKNMRNVCSILLSAFLSKIVLEIRKGLLYFRNSEIYYYSTKLGPPSCLKQPLKKCSYIARNMFQCLLCSEAVCTYRSTNMMYYIASPFHETFFDSVINMHDIFQYISIEMISDHNSDPELYIERSKIVFQEL